MGRAHWHPHFCRLCGNAGTPDARISVTGLCQACGERREIENHRQLIAHNGPWFDHWRRRTLAAFGVTVDTPDQ